MLLSLDAPVLLLRLTPLISPPFLSIASLLFAIGSFHRRHAAFDFLCIPRREQAIVCGAPFVPLASR
jgi:hypothetical protein